MSSGLVIHGAVFLVWYLLFVAQTALVGRRRIRLHRQMGLASLLLALILIGSGLMMLAVTIERNTSGELTQASFIWAIAHTLVCFTLFYGLGIIYRTKRDLHFGFMVLASLSMMSASITRFAYLPVIPIDGTAFTLLLTYLLLSTPLLIDRLTVGRIHPVFKFGVPIYALTQLLSIGLIPGTQFGKSLIQWSGQWL